MKLSALRELNKAVDMTRKQVLLVGGTAGIGRAMALRLAKAKADVVVAGRSVSRGEELTQEMQSLAGPGPKFRFMACDASLLRNTRQLADKFEKDHARLDYLVMTHCIATIQGRTETSEGLDVKLALHYYSRMALIQHFLPYLTASSGRVLTVLSAGVHAPYTGYASDVALKQSYSLKNAADAAGFYTDVGLSMYAEENPEVSFIHTCPGFVASSWGTEMPTLLRVPIRLLQSLFGKSSEDCAEFMCAPLFDTDLGPGFHLRGEFAELASVADTTEEAKPLVWKHTQEVLRSCS
mmetsp:Transcript_53107/g.99508  ORF Transcript_53107/g.99508 Transcript_53107/m.99508 type:complete len:294 (-) Transcript_53107:27-908(-)